MDSSCSKGIASEAILQDVTVRVIMNSGVSAANELRPGDEPAANENRRAPGNKQEIPSGRIMVVIMGCLLGKSMDTFLGLSSQRRQAVHSIARTISLLEIGRVAGV